MRREILFRGKREKDGKWDIGHLTHCADYLCSIRPLHYMVEHKVIPETVGEYTGLKDSAGKMIFEGDIATIKGTYKHTGDENETKVDTELVINDIRDVNSSFCIGNALENKKLKVMVIGNVHDNLGGSFGKN
jgi:uncharacterized phage protein (TIGR01671 family)